MFNLLGAYLPFMWVLVSDILYLFSHLFLNYVQREHFLCVNTKYFCKKGHNAIYLGIIIKLTEFRNSFDMKPLQCFDLPIQTQISSDCLEYLCQ